MSVVAKKHRIALTGNEAVAQAMRQIHPDVVAAYPITPQTEIVQIFSSFVSDGLVHTEYVPVESEHSAMSATVGAAAAGARSMTATSANGLALMWEILYIASGSRLPIVMPVVNRALSGPINIHCDHSDTMGARDSGWIHLYSENAQEAYDNMIQAVRIAEHPDVKLPVMVCMDGFIISHGMENVELLDDKVVSDFVGSYKIDHPLLDIDNPITFGPLDLQDFYFEHKRAQAEAMVRAKNVILQIGEEYAKLTGTKYELFETYRLDDAEVAIVVIGSTAGTAKVQIDKLRSQGIKAGMLKVRVFRPFPYEEIKQALSHVSAIAVLDRADSFSSIGGPLFSETRAAMYDAEKRPLITNYVYGLGGRDINLAMIEKVYQDLLEIKDTGKLKQYVNYLGVRE
ncbi:MAG: pyruvate ferredoxin oxidoreductase [Firmicutes bacterium]|nr:pyruvate ferredoxin oxidoreductase [Bacillota bacterium]